MDFKLSMHHSLIHSHSYTMQATIYHTKVCRYKKKPKWERNEWRLFGTVHCIECRWDRHNSPKQHELQAAMHCCCNYDELRSCMRFLIALTLRNFACFWLIFQGETDDNKYFLSSSLNWLFCSLDKQEKWSNFPQSDFFLSLTSGMVACMQIGQFHSMTNLFHISNGWIDEQNVRKITIACYSSLIITKQPPPQQQRHTNKKNVNKTSEQIQNQ